MIRRVVRRWTIVAIAALVLAGGFGGTASPASAAAIPEPANDPFYQPDPGFEATAPGTVLRSRSVSVNLIGIPFPVRSRQALVRSTDAKGQPIAVVTTLMVPLTPWFVGKRPLVSYQAATDSLGDQCNPSYTMRTGTEKELPLMALALLRGWAVVSTDYQGPRNAYGPGRLEGQAVLDGIRGVESLPGTGLAGASTPVGMWGYSGGAIATSWAAELQPTYAPELNIKGVASGGTPASFRDARTLMDGSIFSGLLLGGAIGMGREYPEIMHVWNADGLALVEQVKDMCVAELALTAPFKRLSDYSDLDDPFADPIVSTVLDENTLGGGAPTAPVYLYHSVFDELIPFGSAEVLRDQWCAQGVSVDFYADVLSEHNILAVTGAPAAVAFLGARFSGRPAPNDC
jgi:hypothetical protein